MSSKTTSNFEKYTYGPVLDLAEKSVNFVVSIPFKAIRAIIRGVENAVKDTLNT